MTVEFEARDHVALITISRPEARNAVNGAVATGMEKAIDRLEASDELWVGIVTGAPPVFCAGADLRTVSEGRGAEMSTARGGFAGIVRRDRRKPLIAAVDGAALAGGCEIALACDLIVASRAASFGVPEVKRSLVAAAGGLIRLPQALPRNVAMLMALTGRPISAEEAARHGMVNVLTERGEPVEAALSLAAEINDAAPLAVQASRAVVLTALEKDVEEAWTLSRQSLRNLATTEDFAEGPRAFLEKRPPVWVGR